MIDALLHLAAAAPTGPVIQAHGNSLVLIVSIVIGALGGTGGAAAVFKARSDIAKTKAETHKIDLDLNPNPIQLAQGAVIVQSGVMKDLQDQVARQQVRIDEQTKTMDEERRRHDLYRHEQAEEHRILVERFDDLQDRFMDCLNTLETLTTERDHLLRQIREQAEKIADLTHS